MALTKVIGNGLGAVTQDGAATFNEGSADVDFRVESNGNANMLFVDGGNNMVGLGTNTPVTLLHLQGSEPDIFLRRTDLTNKAWRFNVQSSTGDLNIKSRNDDGSASTTSMIIAHDGYVTKPLQPSFSARLSSTQSNIAVGSGVTVQFNQEYFDIGSNFNTSNYTFTAPVTGKYQLNARVYLVSLDTASAYYIFTITTSNLTYVTIIDPNFSADVDYFTMATSVLADMDASDTAYVTIHQNNGTAQTDVSGADSGFNGILVG